MNDPDPPNPNPILVPPPKESNDVSRQSRYTRSVSGAGKSSLKQVNAVSKTDLGSMKKSSRKGSKKKRLLKGMDGVEYEVEDTEEMVTRDENLEVDDGNSTVRESNDVSRQSRSTRSVSGAGKSSLKQVNAVSKTDLGSMKKSSRKGSKKKRLLKGMDGVEYEVEDTEEMVTRDENLEVDDGNSTVGVNTNEEVGVGSGLDEVSAAVNQSKSVVNEINNTTTYVNDNNVENMGSKDISSNVNNTVGEMPVPFENNPILNPGNGKAMNHGSVSASDKMSNGNVVGEVVDVNANAEMVWPSLKETMKKDTVMLDQNSKQPMSFVNAFQGIGGYGNNKLAKIPGRINEQDEVSAAVNQSKSVVNEINNTTAYVNDNNVENMGSKDISSNVNITVGEMPVPFENNPILNPGNGKAMNHGSVSASDKMSNGNAVGEVVDVNANAEMVWPSLKETMKKDTVMLDQNSKQPMSFVIAFQGIGGYGNNKLAKIPGRINEQAYGRASLARVLIEVDATSDLVEEIEVCYEKMGKSMMLKVEYTWRPPLCTHCKVFGHEYKKCSNRVITMEEQNEKAKDVTQSMAKMVESSKVNEEWQQPKRFTRNEASTSKNNNKQDMSYNMNRGGFNNRGRGRNGMMGRGNMSQRNSYENNGVRFVQVENGANKVDETQVWETKNKSKQDNKGKSVSVSNEGLNNKNKEVVEEGSDEWVQMWKKIDLACDLGMQIADSEKTKWSEDLKKYYTDKCDAKPKVK
ncbi:hypothetical protein CTI12_AA285500 [Artemisia annua]|uniref:Zinc knuckle CX2CX4HX4C n=1 Tax=Artemisia annua TaxID=35608 RepID=A0A2U1NBU5_ARTAN|nr:hypothetical protein CTI12_AA285500 [Artemisia annua]